LRFHRFSMFVVRGMMRMEASTIWWLIAGAVVIAELMTGSFFLLMVAIGLAAGAVAAHLDGSLTQQLVSVAVVGGGTTAAWYKWRRMRPHAPNARFNRDVNLDIGQTVQVHAWEPGGLSTVQYRGASWQVLLRDPHAPATPGPYTIVEVRGSQLVVEAV
jgi:membrane protein implicated in regulation of membrane protease activity